jgi:hypothetical protein
VSDERRVLPSEPIAACWHMLGIMEAWAEQHHWDCHHGAFRDCADTPCAVRRGQIRDIEGELERMQERIHELEK